jgi:hypothetical protein
VDVLGDRDRIRLDQIDFRIVTGDGFADQFAMLIAESGPGAEEIRAGGGTTQVYGMTRCTVGFI